jgi:hypothetical protein
VPKHCGLCAASRCLGKRLAHAGGRVDIDAEAEGNEQVGRALPFTSSGSASDDTATVHYFAGIGRAPDVVATVAGQFNLDVHSADDAFASHETEHAAVNAGGIWHSGSLYIAANHNCGFHAPQHPEAHCARRGSSWSPGRPNAIITPTMVVGPSITPQRVASARCSTSEADDACVRCG